MKGYIYKITNPKGRVYIGKTTNPKDRFKYYRLGHCQRQTKIHRSLKKYGWKNHVVEIIHTIHYDESELNRLEIYYINEYKSFSTTGLNLTPGGKSGYISELNRKMTSSRSKGKPLSEETKQKLRIANLGKKQSPETVAKRNAINTGKKRSDESRRRISEARKGMKFSESHRLALKNATRPPISEQTREKLRQHFLNLKSKGKLGKRVAGRKVISLIDNKEFVSVKLACAYYGLEYDKTKSILNGHGRGTTFLRVA